MAGSVLVGTACGSTSAATTADDSADLRDALERRVDEAPTTSIPPDTITPTDIADLYAANGPGIPFDPDEIGDGDVLVIETACFLLVNASDDSELELVYESFESWFTTQLLEVGAPPEFVDTWDPRGMLDDLVDMGCAPGATSPPTVVNG